MPLDTNLDQPPYFDDFADNQQGKQYVRPIFKPSVSVQTRELNNLTSMLQAQIERFGDSIYQTGTIVSGCNFQFFPSYPYAKINDTTIAGTLAIPSNYVGYFVKNQANLQALIVNSARGLQSTFPNLNTLYLSYRNAGNNNNTFAFSPGDALTVFDANAAIWSVKINNPGIAFSNTNAVIFNSAIAVNTTSGTFAVGNYVSQPSIGSNLIITSIDSLSLAASGQIILFLAPRVADLSSPGNGAIWQVANGVTLINSTNTAVGMVQSVYGTGASATILTDGAGTVVDVLMQSGGQGYGVPPTVTVWSPNNSSGVGTVSLSAVNFITQLLVSNTAGAVGNGYAFGVGAGVIYQKGYFLQVKPQVIVVNSYSQSPNAVSVGFQSIENIITSNIDTSLLDNVLGSNNANAPGADRLQIIPTLITAPTVISNSSYLSLVNWSEGNPYQQQQTSQYSLIGDKIAQGIYETSGNFVTDPWQIATQSPFAHSFEGNQIAITIDPGEGYINGYRVQTTSNFVIDAPKSASVKTSNNTQVVGLNYGNWVTVNELGGLFQFHTGDSVGLYDTARKYLTNIATIGVANTSPIGNQIGTARIRSLLPINGNQGSNNATFGLYLFDIVMNAGANFANVKSIAYTGGSFPGVADIVLQANPQTGVLQCFIANNTFDSLIFPVGVSTLQSMANVVYSYRTIDQTVTMANNGILSKSVASIPSASFATLGNQPPSVLSQMSLIPLSNSLIASANYSGNATTSTSSANVVGIGTSFVSQLQTGDWVLAFQNTSVSDIMYVNQVVNNTLFIAGGNGAFSISGVALYRIFPQNVPIPLGTRSGISANVAANGSVITFNLGNTFSFSSNVTCALATNILESNVAPGVKTASRNNFVMIATSNNVGGTQGPWCLGVSDVMRMDAVYLGTNSTNANTSSRNAIADFYIDNNQNEDYVDLSFLHVQPGSATAAAILSGTYTWILCQFDAFTVSSPGFFNTTSYLGSNVTALQSIDSTPLANLGSLITSWEVPQVLTSTGVFYDMLNCLDFRPIAANTAVPGISAGTAPVNPTYNLSFGNTANPANDKKFPVPGSSLSSIVSQFTSRVDAVCVGSDGNIFVMTGRATTNTPRMPNLPAKSMLLGTVLYPAYPNMPENMSSMAQQLLVTGIASELNLQSLRTAKRTTRSTRAQQSPVYTQQSIGSLDRRIANLEYYASLSALETDITNTVIPSSVNPSLNRFMYGFFVDNFTSLVSQQINDPQYAANVASGWLTPSIVSWMRGFAPTATPVPSYIDFPVIQQPGATGIPTPPVPTANAANTWLLRVDHQQIGSVAGGNLVVNIIDTQTITASRSAGQVAFYFAIPPTVAPAVLGVSADVTDPVTISIFQGNTLLYTISNNSIALTNTDVTFLESNSVPSGWFQGVTLGPLSVANTGFVSGAGKITWTHNPANGLTYTIVASRQTSWDHWTYAMNYPIDINLTPPVNNPTTGAVTYTGFMIVEPATMLLQDTVGPYQSVTLAQLGVSITGYEWAGAGLSAVAAPSTGSVSLTGSTFSGINPNVQTAPDPQGGTFVEFTGYNLQPTSLENESFTINAYGLLPLTAHTFTVQGFNVGAQCCPAGGVLGAPLITDATGSMVFTFYFQPATVNQDISASFGVVPTAMVDDTTQQVSLASTSILGGTAVMELSAPNSTSIFRLSVAIDPETALGIQGAAGDAQVNSGTLQAERAILQAAAPAQGK